MEVIDILKKTPLFANLSKDALWRLANIAQVKKFAANEFLMHEHAIADNCFLINSGKAEVFRTLKDNKKLVLTVLGPGEIVGELGIIDEQPRTASVMALEPMNTYLFEQWDFKAQMQAYPEIALQLLPVIVRRLRSVEEQLARQSHHE